MHYPCVSPVSGRQIPHGSVPGSANTVSAASRLL